MKRILWIPHTSFWSLGWDGCRQYHLVNELCRTHEIHLIAWMTFPRIGSIRHLFRPDRRVRANVVVHTVPLLPNLGWHLVRGHPGRKWFVANEFLFQRFIRHQLDVLRPDITICSSSYHATGFPPLSDNASIVFDHVDLAPHWVTDRYMSVARAAIAATPALQVPLLGHGKPCAVIPNGVALQRYRSITSETAKDHLGLSGRLVISLIGLTCDPSLYFLDAFYYLSRQMPNVVLLIVGGGKMCDNIKRKAKRLGIDKVVITPGPVRNESVHWYFAATDVGLYPGSDLPYYRAASPLKIVEYSAARAQVVSSPVQFFMQGWPNVHITKPAAAEFADAIAKALRGPKLAPDLSQFDWPSLAHEFDECIWDVDGKVQSVTPTT